MTTIGSIAANNGFFLDTPSSAGIAEEQGKPRQGTDTSRQTYSPGQPVKAADRATDTPASRPRRHTHDVLIPGLPYNKTVENYIRSATTGFETPLESTANLIKAEIKKKWGEDVDPDNTFITTFNYDPTRGRPPRNAKVLNRITLTQAALQDVQKKNNTDEHQTPEEKTRTTLHTWLERLLTFSPLGQAGLAIDSAVNAQQTYEFIYRASPPGQRQQYNESMRIKKTPEQFRELVWNTERAAPYKTFLDTFWPSHESKYTALTKASFVAAILLQEKTGSLSPSDKELALRAANLTTDKDWSNLRVEDLKASAAQDPGLEMGLLSINGFQSSDLLYITDKNPKVTDDGKIISPTLLYIPGNSSPIHRFDSQAQMKNWLAEQAADPTKREALSTHFTLRDQADRTFSDGVNQTLTGLGGWHRKDAPDADVLERLNEFNPQTFITTEPLAQDPFEAITARQKDRSYKDAETQIVTDSDVTKANILKGLETATKVAMLMTPLALVMPEVAVALEVFYVASGVAEAGIGIDDVKHGKKGGADHIVFGVLNALPTVASGATSLVEKGIERASKALESSTRIALTREVEPGAAGASVLVPEGLSADQTFLIKRATHTDVVVGDDVYRYDPAQPDALTKMGPTEHAEPLEDFEAVCAPVGRRVKRNIDSLCYTKMIEDADTSVAQDAQALEHRRLLPGAPTQEGARTVVHEHRLYRVSDTSSQELMSVPGHTPVTYRNQTSGVVLNEPDFGYEDIGQPRALNQETVVVKLDQISDLSDDQRVLRGIKIPYAGIDYVVVEGDTGIYYVAEYDGSNPALNFQRIAANTDPASRDIIRLHDEYKDLYRDISGKTHNNDLVILPSLDSLAKKLSLEYNFTPDQTTQLDRVLAGLSDEKKREVLLAVYAWDKKVEVAAKTIQLEPLQKPHYFGQLTVNEQNKAYARWGKRTVEEQFQTTGIRSANQKTLADAGNSLRSDVANEIVTWLYTRTGAPNYSEVILKTGAGNCDQMARVATDTVNASGGFARIAQVQGHTFSVVGGPASQPNLLTAGFAEPEWADAWIVDPWAGITCPANEYHGQFAQRMQEWSDEGRQILIGDGGTPPRHVWSDPMDPRWIQSTVYGGAQVF